MKTYLLQPLKLQIISSYKFYLINYVLCIILLILSKFTSIFVIEIALLVELLFTLTMGLLNNMVSGNTYYSLKHDRRPFILSSIIINVSNAFIIGLLFIIPMILFKSDLKGFNVLGLISVMFMMLISFSIGSAYSIFCANKKIINIIFFMVLLALAIIFGPYIYNLLEDLVSDIFSVKVMDANLYHNQYVLRTIVFTFPITILLNVCNGIKYMKK